MADRWLHCPTCQEFVRIDESKDLKKMFCGGCGRLFSQADVLPAEGWVYAQNRQKIGPVTIEHLQQRASAGQLQPTDMVLQPGKARWVAASTFNGMFPKGAPAMPAAARPTPAAPTSAPPSTPQAPAKPIAVAPIFVDPIVATPVVAKPTPVQPILVEPIVVEPLPPAAVAKSTIKAVPVEPIVIEPFDVAPAKATVKTTPVEPIVVEPFDVPSAKTTVTPVMVEPIVEASPTPATPPPASRPPLVTPTPPPAAPPLQTAPAPTSAVANPPPVSTPAPAPPTVLSPPAPAAAAPTVVSPVVSATPTIPGAAAAPAPATTEAPPTPPAMESPKPALVQPILVEPEPFVPAAPTTTFPVTPVAVDPIPVEPEAPFVPSSEAPPAVEPMSAQAPDWTVPLSPPAPVRVEVTAPAIVESTPAVEQTAPPAPPAPPRELGWFFVRYGQKLGPVTLPELQEMVAEGQLWPTDMVMKEDRNDWQPANSMAGLFPDEKAEAAEEPAAKPPVAATAAPAPASAQPVAPPAPPPSWPTVPGYELSAELHRGDCWVIYKAEHVTLKKTMALKLLDPDRDLSADDMIRVRKGADASARLRHPGIVQVEAVGEVEGRPYLALEYVEAPRLSEQFVGLPWQAASAARLVQLLAEAIDYAHERGLVHGHLQPDQVLLAPASAAGQPKITGFGVAERFDAKSRDLQALNYTAPEQTARQSGDHERRADVYALGMLLYELLTGQVPFRSATSAETIELIKSLEPVPPCRLQPSVPIDLDTICLKCLQKHPDMRYETAGALAEDLRRFLAGERVRARPMVLLVRGVGWLRQNPRETAIAALGLLFLVMVLARNLGSSSSKELAEARQQAEHNAKAALEARNALDDASAALAKQTSARKQQDAELENYHKVLGAMVEQLRQAPDPELAYTVLWMSVIDARNPAGADQVLDAAEKLLAQHPKMPPRFLVLRGAALYRAGRFDAAFRALNEALLTQPEPPAAAWLFLAMTEQRLRHPDEARHWLDKAKRWFDERLSDPPGAGLHRLEFTVLRQEAENLILGTN